MSELQGIVLQAKLTKLDGWNASRRSRAEAYRERLAGLPIEFYAVLPGCEAVYHLMAICCHENRELVAHLKAQNIVCRLLLEKKNITITPAITSLYALYK